MALTDQQLNSYEQFLKRRSDNARNEQLGNLGNAMSDYGGQSMTNSVNKYNNDRQEDYMNALAKREGLAQTWQQVANQRALTSGQIGNMAVENMSRLSSSALERGKAIEEARQFRQEHALNLQKQQLEQQRFAADQMNIAKGRAMDAIQMMHNQRLQNGELNLAQWSAETNAILGRMNLRLNGDAVQRNADGLRPYIDAQGHITNRQGAENWLLGVLQQADEGNARAQGGVAGAGAARANQAQQSEINRQRIAALGRQDSDQLFSALNQIGMAIAMQPNAAPR